MNKTICLEGLTAFAWILDRNKCNNLKDGLETFMKIPNGVKQECKNQVKNTQHKNIKNFIKFCIANRGEITNE